MPQEPDGVPTDRTSSQATKDRARALLDEAGLRQPPKAESPRRLLTMATVILVLLVIVVAGSLLALDRLKRVATTTTVPPPTTSTSIAVTTTTAAAQLPPGPPLVSYTTASANAALESAIGTGGEPLALRRTPAPTFITDPRRDPVLIYWWTGTCGASCAAETDVVVSALAALGGTFHGLAATAEPGPVAAIDLRRATYRGPVVLEAAEVDGPNGRPDQATSSQARLQAQAYDRPPYVSRSGGRYPFVDVAGRYVAVGAGFVPALLDGLSLRAVAGQLAIPDSRIARAVIGNANQLDAAICTTIQQLGRPLPAMCALPAITAVEQQLPQTAPRGSAPAR